MEEAMGRLRQHVDDDEDRGDDEPVDEDGG